MCRKHRYFFVEKGGGSPDKKFYINFNLMIQRDKIYPQVNILPTLRMNTLKLNLSQKATLITILQLNYLWELLKISKLSIKTVNQWIRYAD